MFHKNQEITLTILELNMMGYGVAKSDGAVFFVQDALPGEECLCRIIKCAKNYYVARVMERMSVSSDRIDPVCSHWKRCGGCVFHHLSYSLEADTKRRYVEACVRKADLNNVTVKPVLSTGLTVRYRNKGQYPVAEQDGDLVSGFYAIKTHKVIPLEDCMIQNAAFAPIIAAVLDFCREKKIPAYDEDKNCGLLRHIYLRTAEKTGEVMLCLVLTRDAFPAEKEFVSVITSAFTAVKSIVFNFNPDDTNVILGKSSRVVWGGEVITDELCGKRFSLSPHSFYQVNRAAAELLYKTAFDMAEITPDTVLLDLYCGVGTIGQCAAVNDQKIYGLEIVPDAIRNAIQNALQNGLHNADYFCGDASVLFDSIQESELSNALLILDPPRKGISADLIRKISASPVRRVLYISCNPQTLTRDLSLFRESGYVFDCLQPVDLFPRTAHVETVAFMTRN